MKKSHFILLSGLILFFFAFPTEQLSAEETTVTVCLSSTAISEEGKTLKKILKIALQPVGTTMYVWGGGWNETDTGAGVEALRIGVSPNWITFFERHNSHYDHEKTRYMIHSGLDCSGYLGWILFNLIPNMTGYVMKSDYFVRTLAGLGWGKDYSKNNIKKHIPGDIMGKPGHVWISLGTCEDGSVLILQSSPPGVSLYGTQNGTYKSEAVALSELYMHRYFPLWHAKFPEYKRDRSFLTDYDMFRWNEDFLPDPDGYRMMNPASVLKDLFGETI